MNRVVGRESHIKKRLLRHLKLFLGNNDDETFKYNLTRMDVSTFCITGKKAEGTCVNC